MKAVCNEVIQSLIEFLEQRFKMHSDIVRIAKSFAGLEPSLSCNLKNVYKLLGSDLDATHLSFEYDELFAVDNIEDIRKMTLSELVPFLALSNSYKNVTTVMARIWAAKPHNTDVERLISTSKILKTIKRSLLLVDTENEYLFIYHNMPHLVDWDSRSVVLLWLKK